MSMIDYLYDGTFEGLLTCIYENYYTEKASGIFREEAYQSNLLGGCMEVKTDPQKAITVYEAIEKKISAYDLRRIYRVFLSSDEYKETRILRYIILGFKTGGRISMMHSDPVVLDIQTIEKKVNVERERMMQFVRFSVMENDVLYAEVEPDHDVLELIAGHFCDRYKNDPFIINDVRRGKALIAYQRRWYISDFDGSDIPGISADEEKIRALWRDYFRNIAIKERTNQRCQKNFMPERYWKHLTELTGI